MSTRAEAPARPDATTAIRELEAAVGKPHVLTTEEDLLRYSQCTSPWRRIPATVVRPGTAEEVRRVVKIAGKHGLQVWPFSKGKNWGYGTTMGYQDGAVILLLERLNRIVEVNEELAYAVIEPGVTQKQLNDHLRATGSRLWTDCTDSTPEGSVIGNALERGLGYTPYGDHFGTLCGLEVVMPDGELLTSDGGGPASRSRHTYKWGTGPYLDGIFAQANYGVVTRAGVWLMPAPEDFACFICEVADEAKLPAVLDTLRRLALDRVLTSNVHLANDMLFLAQITQYPYELREGGRILSAAARAKLRKRYAITPWSLTGGIYGSKEEVRLRRKVIKQALEPFGRVTLLDDASIEVLTKLVGTIRKAESKPALSRVIGDLKDLVGTSPIEKLETIPHIYPILKGVPGERIVTFAYFKSRGGRPTSDVDPARDGAGLMWLPVICPLTGKDARELLDLCVPTFERHGFELSTSFIMLNPRSFISLMEIFYDREDADETRRALELRSELAELTAQQGFPQYRTTVAFADTILEHAPQFRRVADAIKGALDPANILAPGRYGIGLRR